MSTKYRHANIECQWALPDHLLQALRTKFPDYTDGHDNASLRNKIKKTITGLAKDNSEILLPQAIEAHYLLIFGDMLPQTYFLDPDHGFDLERMAPNTGPIWVVRDDEAVVTVLTAQEFRTNIARANRLRDRLEQEEVDPSQILSEELAAGGSFPAETIRRGVDYLLARRADSVEYTSESVLEPSTASVVLGITGSYKQAETPHPVVAGDEEQHERPDNMPAEEFTCMLSAEDAEAMHAIAAYYRISTATVLARMAHRRVGELRVHYPTIFEVPPLDDIL